jgi:hypothetical protein
MAKLNDARRSLQRAKESANKRLRELDEERREIRASLRSLDAALRALGSNDGNKQQKRPPEATKTVTPTAAPPDQAGS